MIAAPLTTANAASDRDEAGRLIAAETADRERICAVEIGVLAQPRAAEAAIAEIA